MDYSEFRNAGHELIDWIADYLQAVKTKPLFNEVQPEFLNKLFESDLPDNPKSLLEIHEVLKEKLIPYCTHVNHPGYMGLITPSPNPAGILGDLLAAALNQNLGAYSIGPSATAMELRVIRWLNDLIGYDENAGGNLTSGGMTANFIGLKLARDWATNDEAQYQGVNGRCVMYVSEERHVSLDKAIDAIGLGRDNLRTVSTNDNYEVNIEELEKSIAEDRNKGYKPLAIIGLAGTTNLGAVDDLVALRKIATRERCWLHVDAAYGGGMLLSRNNSSVMGGLNLADSVTIDPHKWFYAPLDAGAVLVKDHSRLTASFGIQHAYLTDQSGRKNERYQFYVNGFEQSKRFRSLKVWMSFQHYGKTKIGSWIDGNVEQAKYLHELVSHSEDFVSATQPRMSAICLRFLGKNLNDQQLSLLHHDVAARIEREGKFWFATTSMKGKTWFRICPVNIYTSKDTMKELFDVLMKYCREYNASL